VIGSGSMEVSTEQMRAIAEFWWNGSLACVQHRVTVTNVRQRDNGKFVIEFQGREPEPLEPGKDAV